MQKSKSARAKSARLKSSPEKSTSDVLSLREAAKRLNIDPGRLTREAQREGFPWRSLGKRRGVTVEELAAWRAQNIRIRKPKTAAAEATCVPSPLADPGAMMAAEKSEDRFILAMLSGEASAIDISRAAVQLASRQVAKSAHRGLLNPMELDSLKKTLQELRSAEAAYVELEKSRHNLIERDEVFAIVGMCCSRLVQVLSVLENSIATEFSLWLEDPKIRELPADERARRVRDFVVKTTREVRRQEADGVQALLDEQQAENGDDE